MHIGLLVAIALVCAWLAFHVCRREEFVLRLQRARGYGANAPTPPIYPALSSDVLSRQEDPYGFRHF